MKELRSFFADYRRHAKSELVDWVASWLVAAVWLAIAWTASKLTGMDWQTVMLLLLAVFVAKKADR